MNRLIEKLRGKKYYMVLVFDGTQDFLSSTIFITKRDAKEFIRSRSDNRSMREARVLSFRTKETIITLK